MKYSKWFSSVILVAAVVASSSINSFAHAEGGHGAGNGGGGEALFLSITAQTTAWIHDRRIDGTLADKLHLGEAGYSAKEFESKYLSAIKDSHLKFIPASKLKDECVIQEDSLACQLLETSRTCVNRYDRMNPVKTIECNEDLFNAKAGDEQFVINLHENLGLAKIETNDELEFSRYPISKYILGYANPKNVVRWELAAESRSEAIAGCKIKLPTGYKTTVKVVNGYSIVDKVSDADFTLELFKFCGGNECDDTGRYLDIYASDLNHRSGLHISSWVWSYQSESDWEDSVSPEIKKLKVNLSTAKTVADRLHVLADIEALRLRLGGQGTIAEQALKRLPSCDKVLGNSK